MMRLLYDNIIFSLQGVGGISLYWSELVKRTIKDSNLSTTFYEYNNASKNVFRKNIQINRKNIYRKRNLISIKITRYINFFNNSSEVVIFHSSYYRKMYGDNIINVVTVHDFTYEKCGKGIPKYAHGLQKLNALKDADGIICVSHNTKKDMLDLYPKLESKFIRVIYNGYNAEDYYYIPNVKHEKSIVFVGNRADYKNFYSTVDIASKLKNIKLIIVGSALNPNENKYLDNKIKGQYIVYTNISNQELNMIYNKSICLLYLSEYEGFGIPILEAMAAGCPVIALKKSSIPEVAGKAGLLYPIIDDREVCKNVIELDNNILFRKYHVEKGLKNVERFSWDSCYTETLSFYKFLHKLKLSIMRSS